SSVSAGQPAPSAADDSSLVTNRLVTVKKANKNVNLRVETVSDRDDRPSEKENDAGQGPQACKTVRDGSVMNEDKIILDEVEGDVDLSTSTKKGQ
ncbi:hypothetical protein GBF38_018112, partial [Nibea albiflora]